MKLFKRIKSLSASISLLHVFNLILVICVMFFSLHLPAMAQEVVNIPDPNLRAAFEKALGKAVGAPITKAEMETLTYLSGSFANISNLSGIEAATNVTVLYLSENQISDISPLAALTNLEKLSFNLNQVSDISPLAALRNLTGLDIKFNQVSDISPLAALINLTKLYIYGNNVSDLSPLTGLTNLTNLSLGRSQDVDISPLAGLTNLATLYLVDSQISNISPLAGLTNLTSLWLSHNQISDITPLVGLTNLTTLDLTNNQISDITPLVGLTNLTTLDLTNNQIADRDTLAVLTERAVVYFTDNPAFETPGPKIEGPWLWTIAPIGTRNGRDAASSGRDFLAEASDGAVTEAHIATNGANAGAAVGDSVWTPGALTPTGRNNITNLVNTLDFGTDINTPVVYGVISVESPREQNTRLFVGNSGPVKVWLNGEQVHVDIYRNSRTSDYVTAFPVMLQQGENRLFVALYKYYSRPWSGFFGFEASSDVPTLSATTQEGVDIPDANLRTVVERALGKTAGASITKAEMETLTNLNGNFTNISNLSGIEAATNLTQLYLVGNSITDISPLASLTNLTSLQLANNQISDISPLAGLTNLTGLGLTNNQIVDISALTGLTNLRRLFLYRNQVSDISVLVKLTNLVQVGLGNNQISDRDTLEAFTTAQTVVYFPGNPAFDTPGSKIEGPWLWTFISTDARNGLTAASSGRDFLSEVSDGAVTEAYIAEKGATEGDAVGDSIWTPGTLAPTGDNNIIELVDFLGLDTDINTPVTYGVISLESSHEQHTRLYVGNGGPAKVWFNGKLVYADPFGLYGVSDYQTAFPVTLKQGTNRLFVAFYRLSVSSPWSGFFGFESGTEYKVFGSQQTLPVDVNGDGVVNIQDLVLVASRFGETGENAADVNGDGVVNIQDLVKVAGAFGNAAAAPTIHPTALAMLSTKDVQQWLTQAQQVNLTDTTSQRGIRFLEQLLELLTPKETALLPNYPNPFNPETWIPYQLAKPAAVTVSIHATDGKLVRTITVGNQPAGIYQSRAVYWDGRNEVGESVASGVYFYTLTAGEFSATRKMLIRK